MTNEAATPLPVPPRQGLLRDLRLTRDRVLLLAAVLLLWQLLGTYVVDPLWISTPAAVAERLYTLAVSGDLWRHTWLTMVEAFLGLLLAFAVGVPIGIGMARYKHANEVAMPFIMALYSLPRVALAPLFIIWFGIDLFSKVMVAFSTVIFVFMLNMHEGLKTVDGDILDLMKTMKASNSYITRKVLLPWSIPWIIASLRIGVGLALVGAVVGELIGASAGLGWYIEWAAGRLDTAGVFASLTMLIVIAMLANALVNGLEKLTASWRK